jgi:DNA-binding winged helix-turn-helix (wHTH) protein
MGQRKVKQSAEIGLQHGFQLGEWLIEPRELRASSGAVAIVVPEEHMKVLMCLVDAKGEFVDRRTLRQSACDNQSGGDRHVRQAIAAWHVVFGDTPRHPRYIAAAGQDGYALIAHVEPCLQLPIPERLIAAGLRNVPAPGAGRSLVQYAHHLLSELRRRSVMRVAASYLIAMWILLQVAEVTFAPLHLPAWWSTALTIIAVLGMPIMITLAWTYEITSDGVVRDSADSAAAVFWKPSRRAMAPAIIAGVVLMAVVTGYAWLRSIE